MYMCLLSAWTDDSFAVEFTDQSLVLSDGMVVAGSELVEYFDPTLEIYYMAVVEIVTQNGERYHGKCLTGAFSTIQC